MSQLADWASNTYSQFGDDGCISFVLERIGEGTKTCVEFGAGDGVSCSNTANLWRHRGWRAALIEADPGLVTAARTRSEGNEDRVTVIQATITAGGDSSIDSVLSAHGFGEVDLMSIDVDGPDYWIFIAMKRRPRLVVIEFNPTVPPHIDAIPLSPGIFGVGALTMRKAAETRGYRMIGITHANMYLVRTEDAGHFADLETDLRVLMPHESFMYLATDYHGRVVPMGARPEWGAVWPPSDVVFVPNSRDLVAVESTTIPGTGQLLAEIRALRDQIAKRA